jgi:hypothetical protein
LQELENLVLLLLLQVLGRLDHGDLDVFHITHELLHRLTMDQNKVTYPQNVDHHGAGARANFDEVHRVHVSRQLIVCLIAVVLQGCQQPDPKHLAEHLRDLGARREVAALVKYAVLRAVIAELRMQ